MADLCNVLLIEDREENALPLIDSLEANKINVTHIRSLDELEDLLPVLNLNQVIILDWILEGATSEVAKICLIRIRQTCFIPVMVWTQELAAFDGESNDVYNIFPRAYIKAFEKLNPEELITEIDTLYAQPPMSFTQQFRSSVKLAVEYALYNLADHSLNDLIKGLRSLVTIGQNESMVDIEHAIDVLMRLVSREVYKDKVFFQDLITIIEGLKAESSDEKEVENQQLTHNIQDLHMFYKPTDLIVRTGDIVEIALQDEKKRGIVITPACDLAFPRKTMNLRLINIRAPKNTKERTEKKEYLWKIVENEEISVADYYEILVLKDKTLLDDPNIQSVILYGHSFSTITDQEVIITRQKRLDDPYRSDLLHGFVSHAGRIGIPDFKSPKLK